MLSRVLRAGRRASVRQSVLLQQRQLHACWSVLLSHEWMFISDNPVLGMGLGGGITLSDDPMDNARTVLLLHDAHGSRHDCEDFAARLVAAGTGTGGGQGVQCLLVDLRGCGDSSEDDYDPPHTVEAAADDLATLVSTLAHCCTPCAVVGMGPLGLAVSLSYASLVSGGGKTAHSEVTGEGAIPPPRCVMGILPSPPLSPPLFPLPLPLPPSASEGLSVAQQLQSSALAMLQSGEYGEHGGSGKAAKSGESGAKSVTTPLMTASGTVSMCRYQLGETTVVRLETGGGDGDGGSAGIGIGGGGGGGGGGAGDVYSIAVKLLLRLISP